MEDKLIIDLYWARDEEAIAQSEKHYGAYCRQIALSILTLREDAEECVSDTWLRSWNVMPPQRPGRLGAFFARITRNLSLDRWRQSKAQRRGGGEVMLALEELKDCLHQSGSVEEALFAAETAKHISHFLRGESAWNRYLFIRRYWYLDPISLLAARANLSEQQVRARLYRMRGRLKDALAKEGIIL